jgi:hypothetical protein
VVPPAHTNCTSPSRDASIAPSSVAQLDHLEAFSEIMVGYINHMLMPEDIDDRFEHYLEHPAVFAPLLTTSSLSLRTAPEHRLWLPQSVVPHQVGHGCRRCRVSIVSGVSDVCFKCFIQMLCILQWLYMHVASICFKCFSVLDVCFKCFI